ncbi:heavy-metal-associated domain-containing protein [Mycolicibacterium flavescens]|uniref:Heavy metal-binding domain-containing protein n=1 Tax=Mycolicibacterium flavescens TaxID=1776 RepID=A0A1E3RMH6_MYCFV|nr:heavy metal-binding domain-containing protein [Mycolicibacterium flavescens]MCV7281416.1 heavy-metal-associated domain-containing protein [Mycolicibacterium flavescens]ODQ91086.1 heavy metal-binding domain-containing protein [Mycolicibacterium flavescens]
MNAAGRLAAFGAGLAVAFTAAYVTAAAVVPDAAPVAAQNFGADPAADRSAPAEQALPASPVSADPPGLSLAQDGYVLSPVRAPEAPNDRAVLSFTIAGPGGTPLLDYATVHDKQLHLIVVRSDGQYFAHVHPVLDQATGTWSTPWTWKAAGSYRVFADFQPARVGSTKLTLTRTVEVGGDYIPVAPLTTRTTDEIAGYTVELDGALTAGASKQLTAKVSRGGNPVTTLQPYLGAYGHLVALREGDLAYLHVHPEGAEPQAGGTGGPAVSFAATAPTAGRYLLYLDFKVDDTVHTATFVVDAARGETNQPASNPAHDGGHAGGH